MGTPYVISELFRACKGKKGPTVTSVLQGYERTSIRQGYTLRRFTGVYGTALEMRQQYFKNAQKSKIL